MALVWLVTLLVYGGVCGWNFPPLMWWLLLTMVMQDMWDSFHKRR